MRYKNLLEKEVCLNFFTLEITDENGCTSGRKFTNAYEEDEAQEIIRDSYLEGICKVKWEGWCFCTADVESENASYYELDCLKQIISNKKYKDYFQVLNSGSYELESEYENKGSNE